MPLVFESFENVSSEKLIDYPLQAAIQRQSASLSQYEDNGGLNQQWRLNRNSPNRPSEVRFASVINDFLIDLPRSSRIAGERIIVFPFNGGNTNQRWFLREVNMAEPPPL